MQKEDSEVDWRPSLCLNLLVHKVLAHAGVGHTEHGLVQGLLEDQLHGLGELLLGVDDKVIELGHEDIELLRAELVEDGPKLEAVIVIFKVSLETYNIAVRALSYI